MKGNFKTRLRGVCIYLVIAIASLLFLFGGGGRYALNTVSASAASGNLIEIQQYDLDMTVKKDRKIEVREQITVKFLRSGLSMFYRSLPTEGARYTDIVATCEGNDAFHYYVADNPDVEGFFDINCVGNADAGNTWTYDISYVMEQGTPVGGKKGMIVDVVGFGWTVPLHNVTVEVHLPAETTEDKYTVYTDLFGVQTGSLVEDELSADGKTIILRAAKLERAYSSKYEEYVTGGITLEFSLSENVFSGYTIGRIFTPDLWWILLLLFAAGGCAFLVLYFTHTKRDMITVVNIKAPDEMDPMKMGKWLDGTVDNEDVTSMVYYFAHKGYLHIDLTNEDDPTLISQVSQLPADASIHEKTLFNGLFKTGNSVCISEVAGKFYDAMEIAKRQVPTPIMYEKKSVLGYFGGALIGALIGFLIPFLMGFRLGGGYKYFWGFLFFIPVIVIAFMGKISEDYRYKWKKKKRIIMLVAEIVIAAVFGVIFVLFFAKHVMTEWEKILLCLGVFACPFIMKDGLSRTEEYSNVLGEILGFKDFIVVTEEEKIKFMLDENPELYYKVLPYAQVLGVTDEWENKFQKLTIEPPQWCYSTNTYTFDCYLIHRSLNRAIAREIAREMSSRANQNSGGGRVGRSGGGGSFGSFGGGGGGAR